MCLYIKCYTSNIRIRMLNSIEKILITIGINRAVWRKLASFNAYFDISITGYGFGEFVDKEVIENNFFVIVFIFSSDIRLLFFISLTINIAKIKIFQYI